MPHKDPPKVDLGWTDHVPHGDAPVLAAGDHHPVAELGILQKKQSMHNLIYAQR